MFFCNQVEDYLASSGVSILLASALTSLNTSVTEDEVKETLKVLPNYKIPGPDAFLHEYYKTFSPILIPRMTKLFNDFMRDEEIPQDMQSFFLILLQKLDKDHTLCANYRPISLLTSDLKVFKKLLSPRLN